MTRHTAASPTGTTANEPTMFLPFTSSHEAAPRHSAPGLGIAPDSDYGPEVLRYSVVHLGSGLAVFDCVTRRCAVHVQLAVTLMGATGIDWMQTPAVLATEPVEVVRQFLQALGRCIDAETTGAMWCCLGDSVPGTAA